MNKKLKDTIMPNFLKTFAAWADWVTCWLDENVIIWYIIPPWNNLS
jgi:hypothetical protein